MKYRLIGGSRDGEVIGLPSPREHIQLVAKFTSFNDYRSETYVSHQLITGDKSVINFYVIAGMSVHEALSRILNPE